MRKIIPLWMAFLGLSLWVSCGKSDKSEVSRAAETYYNYLIEASTKITFILLPIATA